MLEHLKLFPGKTTIFFKLYLLDYCSMPVWHYFVSIYYQYWIFNPQIWTINGRLCTIDESNIISKHIYRTMFGRDIASNLPRFLLTEIWQQNNRPFVHTDRQKERASKIVWITNWRIPQHIWEWWRKNELERRGNL